MKILLGLLLGIGMGVSLSSYASTPIIQNPGIYGNNQESLPPCYRSEVVQSWGMNDNDGIPYYRLSHKKTYDGREAYVLERETRLGTHWYDNDFFETVSVQEAESLPFLGKSLFDKIYN